MMKPCVSGERIYEYPVQQIKDRHGLIVLTIDVSLYSRIFLSKQMSIKLSRESKIPQIKKDKKKT